MKLTTKFIENVIKTGKYYDQHGLFLHVRPSGAKKWLQRYTIKGRRREVGLGSAKVVSVAQARRNAYNNLILVTEDKAPVQALVIKKLEKSPMFQKELSEVLKKDKSQISNICSSLANDGIIYRSDRTKPWSLVDPNLLT